MLYQPCPTPAGAPSRRRLLMHRRLVLLVLLAGLLASEAIAESCPTPFLLAWGDPGTPLGLAVDASGNVYVANGGWRVQVFDANGRRPVHEAGGRGGRCSGLRLRD